MTRSSAKICFAPIWYPAEKYVTSRLRAKFVVDLFAGDRDWLIDIGYHPNADIAVIVQLCSDRTLQQIQANRSQTIVYDICDRYFETDNVFKTDEGKLYAHRRCLEIIDRADVLIAPSPHLSDELSRRFPGKPCFFIPELVDYGGTPQPVSDPTAKRLLWFGHTTRGNFESAQWILDYLQAQHGYRPVLVTTPPTLARKYPSYAKFCTAWSPLGMRRELARAGLCVVSHAAEEPTKSANRFVTAIMHGVPTLVSGTPSCIEILQAAGHAHLAINGEADLQRVVDWLSSPQQRAAYVSDLQKEMWLRHAPGVVGSAYRRLFEDIGTRQSGLD